MSGRSNWPRHRKVLYFPHRRLWIMEYSCKVWCKPYRRRLTLRQHSRHSWRLREGFPDFSLVSTSVKNPEEGVIGGFLGLPKQSFTATFDPFGVFFRGKYPTHSVH
ncbi:hypothetical protein Taro_043407, partial [Colocasia esculenta]|nr:hypothetical protein [Colocasia esculenta]